LRPACKKAIDEHRPPGTTARRPLSSACRAEGTPPERRPRSSSAAACAASFVYYRGDLHGDHHQTDWPPRWTCVRAFDPLGTRAYLGNRPARRQHRRVRLAHRLRGRLLRPDVPAEGHRVASASGGAMTAEASSPPDSNTDQSGLTVTTWRCRHNGYAATVPLANTAS
jgi:hypothetical protein